MAIGDIPALLSWVRPRAGPQGVPAGLRGHVLAAERDSAATVTWRKGSEASMSARFVFPCVRPAGRRPKLAPDGVIALRWLIAL